MHAMRGSEQKEKIPSARSNEGSKRLDRERTNMMCIKSIVLARSMYNVGYYAIIQAYCNEKGANTQFVKMKERTKEHLLVGT